jgi:hypothetical protein
MVNQGLASLRGAVPVLEGFPELAHNDEVDTCSGDLEMLNPQMNSWGLFEATRRKAEQLPWNGSPRTTNRAEQSS